MSRSLSSPIIVLQILLRMRGYKMEKKTRMIVSLVFTQCARLLVWWTGTEYQTLEWQQAVFTIAGFVLPTADSMKAVAMEGGALKLDLTEQTIFKLIWVKCVFFVVWPHKDYWGALHGPPATNYSYLQTVQLGTLTGKRILKRYGENCT